MTGKHSLTNFWKRHPLGFKINLVAPQYVSSEKEFFCVALDMNGITPGLKRRCPKQCSVCSVSMIKKIGV